MGFSSRQISSAMHCLDNSYYGYELPVAVDYCLVKYFDSVHVKKVYTDVLRDNEDPLKTFQHALSAADNSTVIIIEREGDLTRVAQPISFTSFNDIPYIRSHYWDKLHSDKLQRRNSGLRDFNQCERKPRGSFMYDPQYINIGIHFRWGDVRSSNASRPDRRAVPIQTVVSIVQNIFKSEHIHMDETKIFLFAEDGQESKFSVLKDAFPHNLHFMFGNRTSVVIDIDHMVASDIFIGGTGSFSALLALLNSNGVVILPPTTLYIEKYSGLKNTVKSSEIISGDLTAFNEMLCQQPLYTHKKRSCALPR